MKILIVARAYPKKENRMLGLFEKDQAIALRKAGYDVIYAVLDFRSVRRKRKLGFVRFDDCDIPVFEMNIPLGKIPLLVNQVVAKYAIKKIYKKIVAEYGEVDIVHSHFFKISVGTLAFFSNTSIPIVFTEHSSLIAQGKVSKKEKRIISKAYNCADKVIAVSQPLADIIYAQSKVKAEVIPNIVCFENHMNKFNKKDSECFQFASAGNLIHGKGFDLLIAAMKFVIRKYPNTKMTIYGDGPCRKVLEKKINEENLSNHICLYGSFTREDIPNMYGSANAFVLASRGETFGVVYVEAMAYGLPIIGTTCGGPEDFITNDTGILVPSENVEKLSEAMIKLIENIELYNGNFIREYALSKFSAKQVVLKLTDVYRDIINRRKGTSF